MPSAHGMTSGVPSPPTWMIHGMTSANRPSAPTIQTTPSAPAGTYSVSSHPFCN